MKFDELRWGTQQLAKLTLQIEGVVEYLEAGGNEEDLIARINSEVEKLMPHSNSVDVITSTEIPEHRERGGFYVEEYVSPLTGCVYIAGREPWQLHHL